MSQARTSLIDLGGGETVSALALRPPEPTACFVLAHGAGAGMYHPGMENLCEGLADRGLATLRYQFPYMERGSKRPDPPSVCHATVRRAVAAAHAQLPGLPLFAGGKSFGGRMTSQAQAIAPLPDIRGLCFFAFPLHPAHRPAHHRADHLASIEIPMLFLQGARDALADNSLLVQVIRGLPAAVTLETFDHADHGFHVLKSSGTSDASILTSMLDATSKWVAAIMSSSLADDRAAFERL